MKVQAKARDLRISPRKMSLVAGLVRGRTVADSLVILDHAPRRAAAVLRAVIHSATSNAEHNHKLDGKKMVVNEILVGSSGMIKRVRPVAFGAAHPLRHRLSRLTITLETAEADSKPELSKPKKGKDNGTKS